MRQIITLFSFMFCASTLVSGQTIVSTFAGSTTGGYLDASGSSAQFNGPSGIACDASGTIFVADHLNHKIRVVSTTAGVTTLAGGAPGFTNGTGSVAQFNLPYGVAVDVDGNVYVSDLSNHCIRKITPSGDVSTLAGTGSAGFTNGAGSVAQFNTPYDLALDGAGNVYVTDYGNHCIRKITPSGDVSTFAGSGVAGYADGSGLTAQFNGPAGIALDASGNVFVAEYDGNRIRMIFPSGDVASFAGSGVAGAQDDTGLNATFSGPSGLGIDVYGNLYVADYTTSLIRKITPGAVVTTLAGSTAGYQDGSGTTAQFDRPYDVAADMSGNIYVADYYNFCIRKIVTGVSVNEFLPSLQLNAFPNPVVDLITINSPDGVVIKSYSIMDITGKVVLQNSYANGDIINLSALSSGVYVIEIETEMGISFLKVIKE